MRSRILKVSGDWRPVSWPKTIDYQQYDSFFHLYLLSFRLIWRPNLDAIALPRQPTTLDTPFRTVVTSRNHQHQGATTKFFAILTVIGSLVGLFLLVAVLLDTNFEFVDKGEWAMIALCISIIPYCLARAFQMLNNNSPRPVQKSPTQTHTVTKD